MPNFQKVAPGQDLVIPASTWNALLDAAIFARSQGGGGAGGLGGSSSTPTTVIVKAGADLARWDAVVLGDPVISPDDNEDEFLGNLALSAEQASDDNKDRPWGIMVEPAASGAFARCVVQGATVAWIDITAADDTSVDIDPGSYNPKGGSDGPAQIIWVSGGVGTASATGEQWAVVRLGGAGGKIPPGTLFACALTPTSGGHGDRTHAPTFKYTANDIKGAELGTELTPERPRTYGWFQVATRGTGYYQANGTTFVLSDAYETAGTSACASDETGGG